MKDDYKELPIVQKLSGEEETVWVTTRRTMHTKKQM